MKKGYVVALFAAFGMIFLLGSFISGANYPGITLSPGEGTGFLVGASFLFLGLLVVFIVGLLIVISFDEQSFY